MQAKKAKQLLKARLSRERQIYEMRKRAELKAAVSDLERPWEVVQKGAPKTSSSLFSVSADEQLKVLADRFQKPGGFDLWSDNDGPQIFRTHENLPSARFFPKGVVHSIKPYGSMLDSGSGSSVENSPSKGGIRKVKKVRSDVNRKRGEGWDGGDGKGRNLMQMREESNVEGRKRNWNERRDKAKWYGRRQNSGRSVSSDGEDVYDMSLQGDGSYGMGLLEG